MLKMMWSRLNRFFEGNAHIEASALPRPKSFVLRRLTPVWLLGLLLGFFVASQVVLLPLILVILPRINPWISVLGEQDPLWAETIAFTLNLVIFFMGIYVVMFLWTRFVEKRPFRSIGFHRKPLKRFIFGFTLATVSMAFIAGLLLLFGDATWDAQGLQETGLTALPYVMVVFIGWLVQGSAEEVLFQGWFMPTSSKLFGPVIGIGFSALMFALFHAFNPNMSVLAFLNLALYGVFAALYALYEEGIVGISAYHVAWNWAQGNVFGQGVSGSASVEASLLNLSYTSENLFNGGAFGPEGGLVSTLILTVSLVVVILLMRRKKSLTLNQT